ncbi:MAG: PadR family transcriptional regulator [Bacteroidota bacterium]
MSKLSKDLVAASSVPIILSILAGGEHYGYQIIQKVRDVSGGDIEWADGMLYPILHKLEDKGMIESYWQVSDNGRKRKYYLIRPEGREVLAVERTNWSVIHVLLQNLWNPQPHSI